MTTEMEISIYLDLQMKRGGNLPVGALNAVDKAFRAYAKPDGAIDMINTEATTELTSIQQISRFGRSKITVYNYETDLASKETLDRIIFNTIATVAVGSFMMGLRDSESADNGIHAADFSI